MLDLERPEPTQVGIEARSVARIARSELVALFLRVAGTLEHSAELAEAHADRDERNGLSGEVEQQAAERARNAAARARTVADEL